MTTYSVEIKECSKDFTAKERIALKDTTNAHRLDELTADGNRITFEPDYYAVLHIHNTKSDDGEYDTYIVVDKQGNKYITGSTAFWNSFINIFTEMKDANEPYEIECYRVPSKNYKGKDFITCSIK